MFCTYIYVCKANLPLCRVLCGLEHICEIEERGNAAKRHTRGFVLNPHTVRGNELHSNSARLPLGAGCSLAAVLLISVALYQT